VGPAVVTQLGELGLDYRAAFLRSLPRGEEAALTSGYEIGRHCVAAGVSMLDLIRIHHDVLRGVLLDTPAEEVGEVVTAAAAFLMEVLAPYDMTQRGLLGAD
jgi:hypothetical protein